MALSPSRYDSFSRSLSVARVSPDTGTKTIFLYFLLSVIWIRWHRRAKDVMLAQHFIYNLLSSFLHAILFIVIAYYCAREKK